jgi:hypothetical protein
VSIGDLIVLIGIIVGGVVSLFVYVSQRADSSEQQRESTLASLVGARDGIKGWGEFYFAPITDAEADERRNEAHDLVLEGAYPAGLALRVPTDVLACLLSQPHEARFVSPETIKAVNIALLHFGYFN